MVKKARKRYDMLQVEPVDMYNRILSGELKVFPNNYLDKEAIKEILRYVILDVYMFERDDVLKKVDRKFLQTNHLGGIRNFFDKGYCEALIYSFPEWKFRYWEFRKVVPGYWQEDKHKKEFILWLADKEKLNVSKKEDLRKITADMVTSYGGSKCMRFAGGMYELLDLINPGKYRKWEIIKIASWSDNEAVEAIKWLIEEKLCYTPEQVCEIKVSDFVEYNLDGMLQKKFNHSILDALEAAYPGKYCRTKTTGICLKN